MQIRIKEFELKTAEAPLFPIEGRRDSATSIANLLSAPPEYDLSKHRIAMATAVYSIPAIPAKLKGAKLDRFFSRHNGRITVTVSPIKATSRLTDIPNVLKSAENVSPNTMLYANTAMNVLNTTVEPGIHAVDSPTDFSHALR